MRADVLPFERPDRKLCGNARCIKKVRPRLPGNDPAFCSYGCGVEGQPEHVQVTLRRSYNDESQS